MTPRLGTTVLILLAAGCAPGDGRNEVFGSVTYGGKPVPVGMILFEPDTGRGGSGPASTVQFTGGEYRTEPGRGVRAGPFLARIQGFDGVADAAREMPGGRPMFGEKLVPVDIPAGGGRLDIAVPVSEKKP